MRAARRSPRLRARARARAPALHSCTHAVSALEALTRRALVLKIVHMMHRLEQNRLAAKRAYNKRVAKQTVDQEKLDKIDEELEELRNMVKLQKSQIETMGQLIALLQANPDITQMQHQMQHHPGIANLHLPPAVLATSDTAHSQPQPLVHEPPTALPVPAKKDAAK